MAGGLFGALRDRLRALDRQLARGALDRFEVATGTERRRSPLVGTRPQTAAEIAAALVPGARPLVVHHWATWCEGCMEELPHVVALQQALAGHADLITVSWDRFEPTGSLDQTIVEVARAAGSLPTLIATDGPDALFAALGLSVHQIPQTRVLDADGGCLRAYDGALKAGDLTAIRALLGAAV